MEALAKHEEAHHAYHIALNDLFVVASDEVLRRVTDFHHFLAAHPDLSPENRDTVRALYVGMIKAMREDSFGQSKLSDQQVYEMLPFR